MTEFEVRPAHAGDATAMARLFAAVAAERDAIATEPTVDIEECAALFAGTAADSLVAVAPGQACRSNHRTGTHGKTVTCQARAIA